MRGWLHTGSGIRLEAQRKGCVQGGAKVVLERGGTPGRGGVPLTFSVGWPEPATQVLVTPDELPWMR